MLDSTLFEPGTYLPRRLRDKAPEFVPTNDETLLATRYGLLINELVCAPDAVVSAVIRLMNQALEIDTGDFDVSSTDIILYVVRVAARVDNYISYLIEGDLDAKPLCRDQRAALTACSGALRSGLEDIRCVLRSRFVPLLQSWFTRLFIEQPDQNVDEIAKSACTVQSHILLIYRNVHTFTVDIAGIVLSSVIFITTRHSWNLNLLPIPETEIFELVQCCRRRLISFLHTCNHADVKTVLEQVVQVTTQTESADPNRRWFSVAGPRSAGRFAISSTHISNGNAVEAVEDNSELGIEIDLQRLQLTFRNAHLRALEQDVALNEDVQLVFGGAKSIQAALLETAQNRDLFELVSREHTLQHWKTPDERPGLLPLETREYSPGELDASEQWIAELLEPVRLTYMMKPVPIRILMPSALTPRDATVAVLYALHPMNNGAWKEIHVCRDTFVQVFHLVSHGRRIYRSLVYTTDSRFSLGDMQPSTKNRQHLWQPWERHGAGHPLADPFGRSCRLCRRLRA